MSAIARAMDVARSNLYAQRSCTAEQSLASSVASEVDTKALQSIRRIVAARPTYGYRRIAALLRREGESGANHKRVYRLMKTSNLLLQRYTARPSRTHTGKIVTLLSNTRWCTDAFGIQCWNGEQLQIAFSMDCCDRAVISWVTSTRGIDGELVRDLMTDTLDRRFPGMRKAPRKVQWLSDNGPGYTARQTVQYGTALGFEICTTPAYSPQSNGMAEAFVKTFKRDYVYVNDLRSAEHVRRQLEAWFRDYNENAPHKGLRMQSPNSYLRAVNSVA